MSSSSLTPMVLFAYARPDHLARTLEALRENHVPLIYAFSDGPKTPAFTEAVASVRKILRQVDWCDLRLCEREVNLGLGRSIRAGVEEVFAHHDRLIVTEDDLVCVPGTYNYICAALERYADDPRVMSITGWTHPLVTPRGLNNRPYFDGRAECLMWGAWARSWKGMDQDAAALVAQCRAAGIDPYKFGADLVQMAESELKVNIWAVRFLYLHILRQGLCLRPPHSMVEHIGYDAQATNAQDGSIWSNPPLKECPPLPAEWPEPVLNPQCSRLWQQALGGPPSRFPLVARGVRKIRGIARRALTVLEQRRR